MPIDLESVEIRITLLKSDHEIGILSGSCFVLISRFAEDFHVNFFVDFAVVN